MTQADAEADDDLKLIIFGSKHRCQDLEVSPYSVSKALTFRALIDVQFKEKKRDLSWKSSNFKRRRNQFSNKSQREIYVYQCEEPVHHNKGLTKEKGN